MRDAEVHAAVCDDIAAISRRARLARRRSSAIADPRRRRQRANSSSRRSVVERLTIDRLGHRGDGVADGAGGRSMCPARCRARPSKSKRSPAIPTGGICSTSRRPSAERIAPICPHFGVCGGCAVQHWDTAHYRAWKRDLVVEALRQAGLDAPVGDAHRRPWRRPPPRSVPCPARHA